MSTNVRVFRKFPLEALVWVGGLLALALLDPHANHISICLFRGLGLPYCPGCGLGRSISFLFHGEAAASWQAHPLGGAAAIVLLTRSTMLTQRFVRSIILTHRTRRKESAWPISSR